MTFKNPVKIQEQDGTERVIQIVGLSDSYGAGLRANGKNTGTLFGDDIRITRRVPVSSGKYCQGLPVYAVNYDIVGGGYWKIVDDGGILNGASEFGTGTDANGKIYVSSKGLNRYQAGQLSYYLFTAAWKGLQNSNGDFVALVGASLPGLEVDGQAGDIKEGYMFGWVKESGVLKPVIRVYKRFTYEQFDCVSDVDLSKNLSIFELEVGYLGIHPAILLRVNTTKLIQELVKKVLFEKDVTSVDDPNQAISVYIENKGNTTNIGIRNGSFQYGNYAERESADPSARPITDSYSIPSISSGNDTVVACYTISDKITMDKELNSSGTLQGEFRNTLTNKLKKVIAAGQSGANKLVIFDVYIVPKQDVNANFTVLNPNINLLERAVDTDIISVDLTNANKIVELSDIRLGATEDVRLEEYLLTPDLVGVLTVSSVNTINDFRYTIVTEDLF